MISLSDIYIYALKQLEGFSEINVLKAIALANNDVVETLEDFIDFVNYNIEDNRFENITQPFKGETIRNAVEKAIKNKENIVHYIDPTVDEFPKRLSAEQIGALPFFEYKGNLENLKRKTILITGSPIVSYNARLASEYIGKVLASYGYNILSTFSSECEQKAMKGCKEAKGVSTFFMPHSMEHLTAKEMDIIQNEIDSERSLIISADDYALTNAKSSENTCNYSMALADCLIVPQISNTDYIFDFVKKFLKLAKPVFLVKYKIRTFKEYDCIKTLESLGVKFLSGNTILNQIRETVGEVFVDTIGVT